MRRLAHALAWTPDSLRLLRYAFALPALAVAWTAVATMLPGFWRLVAAAPLIIVCCVAILEAHRMTRHLAFDPDADVVNDYLARFNRARTIIGADAEAPDEDLAGRSVRQAAERGIGVEFVQVLDENVGEIVWELRVNTPRGVLSYRRDLGQGWEDLLDEAGVRPGRRRDGI